MANIWLQFEPTCGNGPLDDDTDAYRCRTCAQTLRHSDSKSAWEHIQQSHRHLYVKLKREEENSQNSNNIINNNVQINNNNNNNGNNNSNSSATTPKTESSDGGTESSERREQVNAELIELVRDNPCLYDKRNEHYKDTAYKARVWEELAVRLDMENGKQATLRWKNLGDTYARNRKRQANGANVTWPHFSSMAWLEQYRERVETSLPTTVDVNRSYDEVLQKFFVVMENSSATPALNELTSMAANSLRHYAEEDFLGSDGGSSSTASTATAASTSTTSAIDEKYARNCGISASMADLASLSAGIFGNGLNGLNSLSSLNAAFPTGFSDIFGNSLLSLAPCISNTDIISNSASNSSTNNGGNIVAKTTTAFSAAKTSAPNATTTSTIATTSGKTTKATATTAIGTTTTITTGQTRPSTSTFSANGSSYSVDEPRLKRARKTIDGILYNLNGLNTQQDNNINIPIVNDTKSTHYKSNDNGVNSSVSTNNSSDIFYKNNVSDSAVIDENAATTANDIDANGGDAYAACEKLKANGESQLFGALIARKLDDLERSARLAAQTEILALINSKLALRKNI